MPIPHTRAAGVLLLSVTLALAAAIGCSKTDTTTTSTGGAPVGTSAPVLTKEQYVAQANAICKIPKDESAKIEQELRAKYPDPKAIPEDQFQVLLKDAVTRLLPLYKQELTSLRSLTPPPGDAGLINKGIDILDGAFKAIEADPNAMASPTWAAYQEGYDYGLTGCFGTTKKFETVVSAVS